MGGAIASLDFDDRPVLRPWSGDEDRLFDLASNVLVPFSNRISTGGFTWNDTRYVVAPNLASEPFPIHGDGFQRPWIVASKDASGAVLELRDGAIGPWSYTARQTFRLTARSLEIELAVQNTSAGLPLPFGCGFHPWFPRSADTRLSFRADGIWMEDARYLPTEHLSLVEVPALDFAALRELPAGLINNGYTGWTGTMRIEQGSDAVSLGVSASSLLSNTIVYSPSVLHDFFCFEPVSHPVDAFNLAGQPDLLELAKGQEMQASITFVWSPK